MMLRGKPDTVDRQAANWLARLHADTRSAQDEAGFRAWLAADATHARAFDRASAIWDAVGGLRADPPRPHVARGMSRRAVMAGGVGLMLTGGLSLGWQQARAGVFETGVGEQRRFILDDGTRIMLDTDTRVRFRARDSERRLSLQSGRVSLDIARDPRPFVIDAGSRSAVAQAARLDVRRDQDQVAFTALQGSARVDAPVRPVLLAAGQRIAMAQGREDRLDRPELDDLTAWQSGRLAFRDETLAQATAEMNRYADRPLLVSDPQAASLRLSGVYRIGDPDAFARSLALLLPVDVSSEKDAIRISAAR